MSRIRRAKPSSAKAIQAATCPDCGKLRYESKADAKRSARRQGRQHSRYYQCGQFWHMTSWSPASSVTWYRERQQ